MTNPYSDLTGNYIGANYNRAIDPNSQYGTRRLNFFVVEINGYDIENELGWNIEQGTAGQGPFDGNRRVFMADNRHSDEFQESPYSIFYPILRALAIKGEVYLHGYPVTEFDGEYPYTTLTVAMADDTQIDNYSDWQSDWTWSIEYTLADALGDFNWDYINVYVANLEGSYIQTNGSSALAKGTKGTKRAPALHSEARAARIAEGKMGAPSAKKSLELAKAAKK